MKMPVVWHGWLAPDSAELHGLFDRASIFCMPSAAESFGMVFAEAMCAGCAVVAASGTAVDEIIQPDRNGLLVAHGDVAALRGVLVGLMQDEAARRRLGSQAYRDAAERYTWPGVAGRYLALFADVVARPGDVG